MTVLAQAHAGAAGPRLVGGRRRRLRGARTAGRRRRAPARSRSSRQDRERWLAAVGAEILDGAIVIDPAQIPSEAVRMLFALQGLIGTLAGPEDPGTAFVAFFHDLGEATEAGGVWGFARGGMGAVTTALRAAAEAAGARVRTEAAVASVHRDADTGAADGVVLEDGEEVPARAACSPTPTRCATAALAGEPAPAGWRQAGPVVKVMVFSDALPDFPARLGPEPGRTIDIGFSLDDLSAAAADAPAAGRSPVDRGGVPDGGRSHAHEPDPTHPARPVAVLPVLPAGRRRGRGGGRRDSPLRRGLPGAARPDRRPPRAGTA